MSAFLYRWAAIAEKIPTLHSKTGISIMVLAHIFYTSPAWLIVLYLLNNDYPAVTEDVKEVEYLS